MKILGPGINKSFIFDRKQWDYLWNGWLFNFQWDPVKSISILTALFMLSPEIMKGLASLNFISWCQYEWNYQFSTIVWRVQDKVGAHVTCIGTEVNSNYTYYKVQNYDYCSVFFGQICVWFEIRSDYISNGIVELRVGQICLCCEWTTILLCCGPICH